MTSKEKIIELQNWFNKNNIQYYIAKTNSIYIENKNYEVIKISNHQLIEIISNPYSRKKRTYFGSNTPGLATQQDIITLQVHLNNITCNTLCQIYTNVLNLFEDRKVKNDL